MTRHALRYQTRRASGLCADCGRVPTDGPTRCPACRARLVERRHGRRPAEVVTAPSRAVSDTPNVIRVVWIREIGERQAHAWEVVWPR